MKKSILGVLFMFLFSFSIFGQGITKLQGTVSDINGDPLPGANVIIKSLNLGTAAGLNGKYSFTVPKGMALGQEVYISARYVGYKTEKLKVKLMRGKTIVVNFTLKKTIFQSQQIVVTGIASKTSKAIAQIAVTDLNAAKLTQVVPYQSLSSLLSGKVPGVQVTSSSGNLGGGFRFYMRSGGGLNGNEQPVIYVDGVRVDNADVTGYGVGGQANSVLSSLDPNNIAKIQIINGPAGAAMYGTSGANGVVLITTKSGTGVIGRKGLSVNYKSVYGYNTQSYKYKESNFISAKDANAIFKKGIIRQNTVSLSGGSNLLRFYTSFDNRYEAGIIQNNSLDRKALRANITAYTSSKITMKFTSAYSFTNISRPQNDNNILGWLGNTLLFPKSYQFTDSASVAGITDKTELESFLGSAQITYTPIKKLEINFTAGVDNNNLRQDQTFPQNLPYPTVTKGQRSIYHRMNKQFTYNFNAHYNYDILNNLKATAIVGAQIFDRTFKSSYLQSETFASNLITDIGAGSKVTDYGEGFLNSRQAGIFTLHSFAYQNRYFLTLGLREDYASSIGKTAPHIIYPKASFAVRLDHFKFFPTNIFSFFKLRAAYGESGQLPGPRDPIALLWQATTGGYGAGATLSQIGNVNIKPERIKEFEVGVETNFLKNYYLDFTYYRQNAVNSIVGKLESPSTGLTASAVPFNVGGIKSWGIQSLFKASLLQTRDYSVDYSMIVNYQYNKVTDLGGAQPIYGPFSNNVIKVGLRKHEFYLQKVLGAKFDATGKYAGVNVTPDRVDFGNPIPSYTGSFTLNIKFLKNFHLYLLTNWAYDRKMYNNTKRFATMFGNNPRYNHLKASLGLTSKLPDVTRLTPGSAEYRNAANEYAKLNPYEHSNFIEKADFLKLNAVSISYNFRDLLSNFNFLKNLVVGISAKNLWTTTNYSGADVELNFAGARSLARGQDFLTLQHPRVYNLWVRLSL